ncbi:MAG: hypothetical protein M1839_006770 [Geoglossum umbratile]|nr:MAG: hypothetical protein M1839_006770 [Geoglossum umbratile]
MADIPPPYRAVPDKEGNSHPKPSESTNVRQRNRENWRELFWGRRGDGFYHPAPVQDPMTIEDVLTILRRMEAKLDAQDKRVEDMEKTLEAKFDALVKRAEDTEKVLGLGGRVWTKLDRTEKSLEKISLLVDKVAVEVLGRKIVDSIGKR